MDTATEKWDALKALRARTTLSNTLLRHCNGRMDRYGRLLSLVLTAREAGTYEAYTALTETIGGTYNRRTGQTEYAPDNEFRIGSASYTAYYGFVFEQGIRGIPELTLLDPATLAVELAKLAELETLFESRNTTDIVDSMYGRTSRGTYYLPTGEKVTGSRSRQGSLGS